MKEQKKLSLLLVEDDDITREVLTKVLSLKFSQCELHSADNGSTGLECFKKYLPSIVITDVNMPVLDGIRMAVEMKSIKPDMKLIVISAYSDKTVQGNSAAVKLEIDHYLLKPVEYGRLFAVIEQCLEGLDPI
jgi:YesN/AraC family two-component response regulator